MSLSNLPPGVSGNELEIAGPDTERESEVFCRTCGSIQPGFTMTYQYRQWFECEKCETITDLPDLPEPDYLAHAGEEPTE